MYCGLLQCDYCCGWRFEGSKCLPLLGRQSKKIWLLELKDDMITFLWKFENYWCLVTWCPITEGIIFHHRTGYTQKTQGSSTSESVGPKPLHDPAVPTWQKDLFCTSKFGPMVQPTQWVMRAVSIGVSQQNCEATPHKLSTARILACHPPYVFLICIIKPVHLIFSCQLSREKQTLTTQQSALTHTKQTLTTQQSAHTHTHTQTKQTLTTQQSAHKHTKQTLTTQQSAHTHTHTHKTDTNNTAVSSHTQTDTNNTAVSSHTQTDTNNTAVSSHTQTDTNNTAVSSHTHIQHDSTWAQDVYELQYTHCCSYLPPFFCLVTPVKVIAVLHI